MFEPRIYCTSAAGIDKFTNSTSMFHFPRPLVKSYKARLSGGAVHMDMNVLFIGSPIEGTLEEWNKANYDADSNIDDILTNISGGGAAYIRRRALLSL